MKIIHISPTNCIFFCFLLFLQLLLMLIIDDNVVSGLVLNTTIAGSTFFDNFKFNAWKANGSNGDDFGYYVDRSTAESLGLIAVENGKVKIWCDHTTVLDSTGIRKTLNIETPATTTATGPYFDGGLLLFDFEHMPTGKGTWPSFWLSGQCAQGWPNCGELDIIEGGDGQLANEISAHTDTGCTIPKSDMGNNYTGTWLGGNCCSKPATDGCSGAGCTIKDVENTFGPAVNQNMGGIYAIRWVKGSFIKVWWFPRALIPSDITAGNPLSYNWGRPTAMFRLGTNCAGTHFTQMRIRLDIFFCGSMANKYFAGATATERQANCIAYVRQNPSEYLDAYWLINSIKIYV